ncbi:O-antigen ligase family protein [Clostridium sardiniense]
MLGNEFTVDLLFTYIRMWLLVPIVTYIYFFIETDKLLKSLVKYSLLINAIGLIQIISNFHEFGRIQNVFSHPNFYAFYLIIIVLAIIYFIKNRTIKFRIGIVLILFNLLMIIAAGSKTAIIAFIAAIMYVFYKYLIKANKYLKIPILIISILGIILFIVIFKDKFSELRIFNLDYGLKENQINSFEWRILNWKSKFSIWENSIFGVFFGYGWGSEILYGFKGFAMHNEYLRVLFEYGIMGCICIFIFAKRFFYNIMRLKSENLRSFYIGFIIIIVVGAMAENIFVAVETLVLYIGIIFSSNSDERID